MEYSSIDLKQMQQTNALMQHINGDDDFSVCFRFVCGYIGIESLPHVQAVCSASNYVSDTKHTFDDRHNRTTHIFLLLRMTCVCVSSFIFPWKVSSYFFYSY